jgi:hypothetical protein
VTKNLLKSSILRGKTSQILNLLTANRKVLSIDFHSTKIKEGFMRFNYFFKILILLQFFYSLCAQSYDCPDPFDGEMINIANTESVHFNEVTYPGTEVVYADPMDFEFWVGKCENSDETGYYLMLQVTPTEPGKSRGRIVYDYAVIQNNQQYDLVLNTNFSDNLYVPTDYWLGHAYSIFDNSGLASSHPDNLDLSKPFTLVLSCSSIYYQYCSPVNPDAIFEIDPQVENSTNTISSVNGSWHDPAYGGSGYNVVQTPIGYLMYFYGYKEDSNGEALWLISSIGPQIITKDETFTLDMLSGFPGNGGSLTTKPNTPNSGTTHWGTADVTFNDCRNGVVKLTKDNNTAVTHTIKLLAGIDGVDCVD